MVKDDEILLYLALCKWRFIYFVIGSKYCGGFLCSLEHTSYIDAYIPSTRTIIEQKSHDVNLDRAIPQSDGQTITPYQQAQRYSDWLPDSQRAR